LKFFLKKKEPAGSRVFQNPQRTEGSFSVFSGFFEFRTFSRSVPRGGYQKYIYYLPVRFWGQGLKEGSLFVCFVFVCIDEIHRTGMLQITFLVSWESSGGEGVHQLRFHGVWTCSAKVLEYWMIFSLKIKLNHSWKFRRNWNVPLVSLERSWWARFNGIYLVRFGFRMWERYWF